jgi:beta-aspartyl-peptidase (threonine type)
MATQAEATAPNDDQPRQDAPVEPTTPVTGSWHSGPARWSILVHGGAGDARAEDAGGRVAGCERAAAEGARILAAGGSALDAVQRAVEVLESDPLFNAGTGACLDADGHIALDASIMNGADLRAGGVCALPPFEHPIAIARRVMDATRHVLLAAEGAARFAVAQGFVPADEASMITEAARKKLESARAKNVTESWPGGGTSGGTVGAVARDAEGHVAAATSTGGMVNKLVGRVGDSPIVGAGCYADDEAGACSTTGYGEAMMRVCLAKTAVDELRVSARGGAAATTAPTPERAEQAAHAALTLMHRRTAQTGGLIMVAPDGSLGLARTTRTMTWACSHARPTEVIQPVADDEATDAVTASGA